MRGSIAVAAAALLTLVAPAAPAAPADTGTPALDAGNPFAAPSSLPYGLPPFASIKDSDFMPAFRAGMAEQLREVAAITANRAAPTFANTALALERSGRLLDRVEKTFVNLNASNSDAAMAAVETETAPLLAAHRDAIDLDPALFARLDRLYRQRRQLGLDPESLQLLVRQHRRMVRAGARLPDSAKARLRDCNTEISSLMARFRQNLLKATNDAAVVVGNAADLDGLSAEQRDTAAAAAAARGLSGKWLLTLVNTTGQPYLAELKSRPLRERIYRASISRGMGGPDDNTVVVARIVRLRAERARLLGYASHAASVLDDETAGTPAAADAMLRQLAPAARAAAEREAAAIQQLIDRQAEAAGQRGEPLQPWDWDFYAEQIRKASSDYDESAVRPYFELNQVVNDGLFYTAHELYGLSFHERSDLPAYAADVHVYEVRAADQKPLGLFITDYYARDNKQGGAWMDNYVDQSRLFGQRPVIVNNLNIPKPPAGQPTLLSFDDVVGLFHEFGHAMHGMLSNVEYETLSGTRTARDFVEFPSQYNEMWAREPAVLQHYARHYQTGEPLPDELLRKVIAAQQSGQGYDYMEKLAAAVIDLALHEVTPAQAPGPQQLAGFEQAALLRAGLAMGSVPPRYHATYFRHVFGDDYSAGYYAYLWSEVLARDSGAWLHRHGGLTRANGEVLRDRILSRGRTEEPRVLFRRFYGRDPEVGPLLEYHGLGG